MIKRNIPNAITCLNLLSGCIAVVMVFRNQLYIASGFVLLAAVFDFFDGMVARMLKTNSPLGIQLDSLADVISFGFAPAAILFKMLQVSGLEQVTTNVDLQRILQFLPFSITVFAAIRLARFNIDPGQSDSFIGLPTPAAALFVLSLPLIIADSRYALSWLLLNPWFLLACTVLLSYLMVSGIPLMSLKFSAARWRSGKFQFILIALSMILFFLLHFAAIPIILFFYVLLSLIKNARAGNKT